MNSGRQKLAGAVEWITFFLLLMTLAARPFIVEMPYRTPIVAVGSMAAGQGAGPAMPQDREEFSRVTFALLILGIGALWVAGRALAGRIKVRGGYMGVLIAVFGALSLASALCASDKRTALDCWIEQLSFLGAGFLAIQLCGDKRRFMLLVILLGALAGTMAVKAFWQRTVEIPAQISDFDMYRNERLGTMGWAPGSPQAQAGEARFKDTAVHGFFALSNVFASLMIILTLACAGLAFANVREAVRRWKATRHKPQATRGKTATLRERAGNIQIDLQGIAGLVALAAGVAGAIVLAMTLSKGGAIAGALAAVAAAFAYFKKASLACHWKRWLLCVAGGFVLMGAAVAAWGLTHDGLPIPGSTTKTMTFRWYYWTASAEIIRDNPLLGVGGGNFDTAYLRHRRAAAEESVKMPHNVLLHSLSQFGMPGGLCYIAIVGMVLVGASRPRGEPGGAIPPAGEEQAFVRSRKLGDAPAASNWRLLLALALLVPLAVLVTRWIFFVAVQDQGEIIPWLLMEAVGPAVILAAALALLGLAGHRGGVGLFPPVGEMGLPKHSAARTGDLPGVSIVRIAVACGCWGFFLHGLVDMGFWVPGSAMFFWVAAGACMARGQGADAPWKSTTPVSTAPRALAHRAILWLAAAVAIVAVCAAAWLLWLPCAKKDALGARMHEAVDGGHMTDAVGLSAAMGAADPFDAIPAAETAKLLLRTCPPSGPATRMYLVEAGRNAQEATKRNPLNSSYWQLAAQVKRVEADSVNFKYWNPPAVDLDKEVKVTQAWQANALASAYFTKGDYGEAERALEKAIELDEKSWMLHARLGDALWMQHKHDRACAQWGMAAGMVSRGAFDNGATEFARQAVSLDPMNSRVHLWAAQFFCDAREPDMCLRELAAAERIQGALFRPSVDAFNPTEVGQVEMLKDRAACIGH